jgi:hypothetical protein
MPLRKRNKAQRMGIIRLRMIFLTRKTSRVPEKGAMFNSALHIALKIA